MDLELTDEQTLAQRVADDAAGARLAGRRDGAHRDAEQRARLWAALVDFGARVDDEGSGRSSCASRPACSARIWPPSPFLGSAALRYARAASDGRRVWRSATTRSVDAGAGRDWSVGRDAWTPGEGAGRRARRRGRPLRGRRLRGRRARARRRGRAGRSSRSLARRRRPAARRDVRRRRAREAADARRRARRPIGALLAAAESVGAAERHARGRARLRGRAPPVRPHDRQLPGAAPHPGGHVRAPASAWSTVLYAAAALDDDLPEAQQTAAVAKAYVARAAREVAHGALQVFGGIAFTEEHQAHRFLRRIVVREQQFGDAAHHERELGRARSRAVRPGTESAGMTETGFNDPTAQRLERISDRRRAGASSARCSPTSCTTRAGATATSR